MNIMTRIVLALMACVCALAPGCVTGNDSTIVTPARVQAVSTLAAFYGAKAAIAKGYREEVVRCVDGLKVIEASASPDIGSVILALDAAHVSLLPNDEGQFVMATGAVFFADLWSKSGQTVLTNDLAKAFVSGVVSGASQALGSSETKGALTTESEIISAARQSRNQ